MKTCILIAGEPRMFEYTYFTVQPFAKFFNADVFLHCWESETTPRTNDYNINEKDPNTPVENLEELLHKYYEPKVLQIQPKSKLIEYLSNENILHIPKDQIKYTNSNYGSVSQWYSIQEADRIKQEYEKNNNIKYDIQIKTRFDTLFMMQGNACYERIRLHCKKIMRNESEVYTPWFHIRHGEILMEYSTLIGRNTSLDKIWENIIQDISFKNIFGHSNPHYNLTKHFLEKKVELKHWEEMNGLFRIIRPHENNKLLRKYWDLGDNLRVNNIMNEGSKRWGI